MEISTATMLERLVAIDTTSSRSNLALIETVADYLDGHGVAVKLIHDAGHHKANLFATIGPESDGGIVLSGHTDCVPVDARKWSSDPFRAVTREGRIYGRGTCDMKGFIAAVLALVPEMIAARPATPLHLAFSYDEELGCRGVPGLLARIAGDLPQPRIAIIGEPTGMTLVNAHKGISAFETVVEGLEAHSSLPDAGLSAVVHGAEVVLCLDRIAREMAEHGARHDAFVPPYTTINVGRVEGGAAFNVVAGRCRIQWECRPIRGEEADEILQRLERFLADDLLKRMHERHSGASVATRMDHSAPPLVPSTDSPAETLVRRLAGIEEAHGVAFTTEAGLFQQAGMSAVVIGPGFIEQAHKPDEYVSIEQLGACERFLRKLIQHAAL